MHRGQNTVENMVGHSEGEGEGILGDGRVPVDALLTVSGVSDVQLHCVTVRRAQIVMVTTTGGSLPTPTTVISPIGRFSVAGDF